jgi:hypothetical protein
MPASSRGQNLSPASARSVLSGKVVGDHGRGVGYVGQLQKSLWHRAHVGGWLGDGVNGRAPAGQSATGKSSR